MNGTANKKPRGLAPQDQAIAQHYSNILLTLILECYDSNYRIKAPRRKALERAMEHVSHPLKLDLRLLQKRDHDPVVVKSTPDSRESTNQEK